jgi:hypothetical protein
MNLTWHIVKKDLRALKWPLGLWLLCVVAKLGVGVMLLNATGDEGFVWFQKMDMLAKGLATGELLSFVLVAALIQEDLMVGTSAFWMTRPISGGRLLRAKLLTIALVFLIAPVLVTLPWWLGCNYGPGEIAWAAAETVAVHAIVVLIALLWSAVTDGLGRFLMWTLVTLAVTPMLSAIIGYYLSRKGPGPVPEILSTRVLGMIIIMVVGIMVVLVHQYLTRHTWRSIAVIGAMIVLCVLTLGFWPWAWNLESKAYGYIIRRAQGDWPATAEPAGLKFTLRSAEFAARKDRPNRPGTLAINYSVEGLAQGQGFISYPSEHFWQWPNGSSEKGYTMGRSVLTHVARTHATAFAKGEQAVEPWSGNHISMLSVLPSSTMGKVRAEPPAYALQARLQLMKFESTTPVPLQAGAWETAGVNGERIAAVEKSGDQLHITFVRHTPALWVDVMAGGRMAPSGVSSRYFLVNRTNQWVDAGQSLMSGSTRVGTVEITWQTLFFHASPKAGPRPTLEAINALNDAELIKVSYTEQARFTHELRIDAEGIARANP